jgi:hypothetical protein
MMMIEDVLGNLCNTCIVDFYQLVHTCAREYGAA